MPFCTKCGQEYDEGVKECADCMVPLAGQLDNGKEETESGRSAVVFRASDGNVLDLMCRAVAIHHIPVQKETEIPSLGLNGHLMLVPHEAGEKVQHILDHGVPMLIGEGEGEKRIYRMYKSGEEEEIRDPELLKFPTDHLVARGEEVLDELVEIVVRGDGPARRRAAYVLSQIGESGILALGKIVKMAVLKEREQVVLSLLRVIRDEMEGGQGWRELEECLAGSEVTKVLALQAICAFQNIEAFPLILPLLDDPSPVVRDEADNALCTLSDEDMGFDTQAGEEERARVKAEWHAWWSKVEARRNG